MFSHKLCAVKVKWVSVNLSRALVLNLGLLLILWSAHANFKLSTLRIMHATVLQGILNIFCGRWWVYFHP